ncbi:ABC transporter substrate-binding protein [Piscinibacter sp.]|uniref:ABC transporter substrate-binding protein n=1 Tax=Piscinibacter sp. TaxID=1903157 RepID=UPI003784C586
MTPTARLLAATLLAALAATSPAQSRKDSVVLGMVLEPAPGLDPTMASAAAIGEVVHLSVLEGLTKIGMDGTVSPLLAESWSVDPDGKVYSFKLRRGVKFHDGEAFDASDVKFSFERAKAEGSTNKAKKSVFDNISRIETPDPYTVILVLERADGNFLFRMGEATAAILDPKSAAGTATKPIGTGPFRFEDWKKGASITLAKNPDYRNAAAVKMKKVTWRFISDPAAQVSALLAGDIDGMPRFGAPQNLPQFQADKRFTVAIGGTEGKTIVAINNKRKPFDDVRVRRAVLLALDKQQLATFAAFGHGTPTTMTSRDAVALAAATTSHEPCRIEPGLGFEAGEAVTVMPTDYGRDPVAGTLVGLDAEEVVIRRHDERAGTLHVHFPRLGFQIRKEKSS